MKYQLIKEQFPHFHIIKASAGTGKTYILSQRLTAMLLSDLGQKNNELRNILAITFTVNASKEMRQRVIGWLKRLALDDQTAYSGMGIPESEKYTLRQKAEALIETILTQYRDLQIKTIDSFLASVFKACALDFGYHEDFKVVINNREYMKSAFDLYLEGIKDELDPFFETLDIINETEESFSFLPQDKVFDTVRGLYIKERHHISEFVIPNKEQQWEAVVNGLKSISTAISNIINVRNAKINSKSSLNNMLRDIDKGDFTSLFKRGDKTSPILKADEGKDWANELSSSWQSLLQKRQKALEVYAEVYYQPYIKVLKAFEQKVEAVKKDKGVIFIEDIPSILHKEIQKDLNIPDVYMKLGGRLYHYFIDEFQDTSPIQYENLKPFIENSLAEGGSLFIVGDTKQAIYGFRDTDYEIMNALIKENPFKSVKEYCVRGLERNYRSGEVILNYAKEVFDRAKQSTYDQYSDSGLFDWEVDVREGNENRGYVEARIIGVPADDEATPVREIVLATINDLINRGYQYRDIAIIAHKNKQVTEVSSWLSDANIPFVSFSSLDIRNRRVVKELLHLLRFLDNPTDNLSFGTFLRGDIFRSVNDKSIDIEEFLFNNKTQPFLYKCFQGSYKQIWDEYFEGPFNKVGYLPIYELLCSVIMAFEVSEHFKEEAGAIARLLEIVKDLEAEGKNSLREFLDFIELQDEEGDDVSAVFELPIPENINAIRVMTVHKAKGLGFPVVIYLVYPLRKRASAMKIDETDEGLKALRIKSDFKSDNLQKIYEHIEKKDKINDLNSLYVGLTRAMDELYLFGIAYESKKSSKSENVSDVEENQPKDNIKKEFPVDLIIEKQCGNKTSKGGNNTEPTTEEVSLSFVETKTHVLDHDLANEEKRRGEAIHLVLSRINNLSGKTDDDVNELVTKAIQYTKNHYPDTDDNTLQNQIKEFIIHEGIRTFFYTQDMEVYTEKEFVDKDGQLLRIDRLLIGKDKVQVIDFKTGQGGKDYSQQIGHYISTLREIYTVKDIMGYILYFDLKEVEEIKA